MLICLVGLEVSCSKEEMCSVREVVCCRGTRQSASSGSNLDASPACCLFE